MYVCVFVNMNVLFTFAIAATIYIAAATDNAAASCFYYHKCEIVKCQRGSWHVWHDTLGKELTMIATCLCMFLVVCVCIYMEILSEYLL